MELLQIRDFGKSGLNTDLPKWDLPPGFLTNAQNFRIFNNKIFGFGGQKTHVAMPDGFDAYHVLYAPRPDSNTWIYAGNKIYAYDGIAFHELGATLPAYAQDPEGWTSCSLGRVPVLNNSAYYPMAQIPQDNETDFAILPYDESLTWQDKNWHCKAMRSFGPYLIAMNMTEEFVDYPDTVRWSSPAERNYAPSSWDETDPASLASINSLGGDGGDIIDGLQLRNSFVLYRDFGITTLDHTGDSYVFNAQDLTTSVNIAGINSICEVKGRHFIISSNDIVQNTGDQVVSLMHAKVRVLYANIINQDYIHNAFAVHNVTTKEYWAFLPTSGSIYPNQVWVYNYRENSWSIHDVNVPTHADYGRLDVDTRTWANWDETWGTATGSWARQNNSVFNNTIMGPTVTGTSSIQLLDFFTSETDFTTILERTDYQLTTMQDVNTITRIYPHLKSTQPVYFQVGSQQHAGGPVRWKPRSAFNAGIDRKIDVITTGELFAFRIEAQNNSSFEFSGLDVEYTHAGLR